MDFGLTEEQELLRETAQRFVADVCPPEQAKAWDESNHAPPELFAGFATMGWFELPFPIEAGGGGGGAAELLIVSEELGRASLDIAQCFVLTLMAGLLGPEWGSDDMRHTLVPAVRPPHPPPSDAQRGAHAG